MKLGWFCYLEKCIRGAFNNKQYWSVNNSLPILQIVMDRVSENREFWVLTRQVSFFFALAKNEGTFKLFFHGTPETQVLDT